MDSSTSSAQFNTASNSFSNLQYTPFAKSSTSVHFFSRDVVEAARILCAMSHYRTTYLHSNKPFSIQSILGIGQTTSQSASVADNNLHSIGDSIQDCINVSSKTAVPVAIMKPQPTIQEFQQHNIPAEYGSDLSGDLTKGRVEETTESSSSQIKRNREYQKIQRRERRRKRYRTDPAFAERERERLRELRKDPAYIERQRELRKDPAYAKRQKCQRKRRRERYHSDPVLAQAQRTYANAYYRIKKETCNKEVASRGAKIAKAQFLQSVNSVRNSGKLSIASELPGNCS
ncbi:hypothetical protein [Endozoicomonas sp. SCSIO W0465]|uniref:hypothetical protein n=1 Tax=Endozoicomonas sp. SCSIO W0465 TaxID=2918516 RepID=UPI002076303C|nr:hypothetical protein [Endozoicomonas sp. SCSIO W0465]USE35545.1 hypothetical protein MJO57_26220 [Endozoicomonas sp. SCSIO W0465]